MAIRKFLAYLFSFRGRISRLWWWLGQIGIFLPSLWVVITLETVDDELVLAIAVASAIPLAWIDLAISAKRYHDLNYSGWRQLLALIPLIGSVWVIIELGFFSGASLANRYGHRTVCGGKSTPSFQA